jgi:hypothetical protein
VTANNAAVLPQGKQRTDVSIVPLQLKRCALAEIHARTAAQSVTY